MACSSPFRRKILRYDADYVKWYFLFFESTLVKNLSQRKKTALSATGRFGVSASLPALRRYYHASE